MKKIFQNKSFLKSIRIFLVCLVVLGGGLLENDEAKAACSITGSCPFTDIIIGIGNLQYSYARTNAIVSVTYQGGNGYKIVDDDVTVLYRSISSDCNTKGCGFFTLLKENSTPGDYYFLIGEDDFMPGGSLNSSLNCIKVCQAFENDFITNISENLIGGTINYSMLETTGIGNGPFSYSIITADSGTDKIHFVFSDYMISPANDGYIDAKGWDTIERVTGLQGSLSTSLDICGIFPLPTCTLTANPISIDPGESSNLTWTTENTDSADINGVAVNITDLPNSGKSVSPDSATPYKMTVTNTAGDTGTCSATVGVKVPPDTTGGLVPCGRLMDDCGTAWDERADCNLCHFIIMGKLIIDFLLKIAVVVGALFLALGGILYILAAGDIGKMALAKGTISRCLLGFAIIFVGWMMVNTVMVVFGYVDLLDSGGKWHKITCNVPMRDCASVPPAVKICGDGNVDTPNDAGFFEECDTDGSSCGSLVCNADCTCKTEPTPGVCGVWFTGGWAGSPPGGPTGNNCCYTTPFGLNDMLGVQIANWVANGNYPVSYDAFTEASDRSFDGIVIDENTRLQFWYGENFINEDGTTNPILDITGPVVINHITEDNIYHAGSYTVDSCFGLSGYTCYLVADLVAPKYANMTLWSRDSLFEGTRGSCKITCVAPEE